MFTDTFRALGAETGHDQRHGIYEALKSGKVDAQENPLAVNEVFKLYEVQSIWHDDHMWSGFNLMANGALWRKLPEDIGPRSSAMRPSSCAPARRSRPLQRGLAHRTFAERGMIFNEVDQAPFRARMLRSMPRGARSSQQVLGPARRPRRKAGLSAAQAVVRFRLSTPHQRRAAAIR